MFPPQRIVCLTEETVETLYLLGEEDRIVGVSGYAVRPPQVRREKPRVSAFISADIPKILALKPDLVLTFCDLQADIDVIGYAAFVQSSYREYVGIHKNLGALHDYLLNTPKPDIINYDLQAFLIALGAARVLLAVQGVIMCGAAILAGRFAQDWPHALVLAVCAVAGATASGFTGIAYAEWARIGGARRTEATGLGAGIMFSGVLVLPLAFSVAVAASGEYAGAYTVTGLLAAASGLLLLGGGPRQAAAK